MLLHFKFYEILLVYYNYIIITSIKKKLVNDTPKIKETKIKQVEKYKCK